MSDRDAAEAWKHIGQPAESPDLTAIRRAIADMRRFSGWVGQLPPEPPTLRGRVGAFLIGFVRRALFWYTPQIIQFHNSVLRALEQQFGLLESMAASLETAEARLNRLEETVLTKQLRSETTGAVGASAVESIRTEGLH